MFSATICVFIFIPLVSLGAINGVTYNLDQFCPMKNGYMGTCKYLSDCKMAQAGTKKNVFPDICTFEGTRIIVCCGKTENRRTLLTTFKIMDHLPPQQPSADMDTKSIKPTIKPTRKPPDENISDDSSEDNREPGDKSKEMCREYAKYAREKEESQTLFLIPKFSDTLECAFEKLPLVSGGTLATIKEFPHMAMVGYKATKNADSVWSCGGSLISENFVLTAAHCLKSREYGLAKLVRVGITNLTDLNYMQELEVEKPIWHPEYDLTNYHDIGLVKLKQNVDMNPYARPACLFTEKTLPTERAIASGWGAMNSNEDVPKSLLKVVLDFFSQRECNATYRNAIGPYTNLYRGILDDVMICAGTFKDDRRDTCRGDSGGPLQIYHDDTKEIKCMYSIIGITSFGKGCGLAKNHPGVYTRVSHYLKWIEDTVWPSLEI